jgi:hypothetical protein
MRRGEGEILHGEEREFMLGTITTINRSTSLF